MKDMVIISNYWHISSEKSSSRYLSLVEYAIANDFNVEVITSSFYHAKKIQRTYDEDTINSMPYKMTLIKEKGYKKNISVHRILSHYMLSKNIIKYLKNRKKPDVIYCFFPPLSLGNAVIKYANKHNIKVITDILDLWPEAYNIAFNFPILKDILFSIMKKQANYVFKNTDKIIAVSNTYKNRALEVAQKDTTGLSVYIGVELSKFDTVYNKAIPYDKPKDEIWVVYVGTIGHSYDFYTTIKAFHILKNKGYNNIKLKVLGDGPLKCKIQKYAESLNVNAEFMGNLEYYTMVSILKSCDLALNPLVKGAAQSIINKHGDYLAAKLPIINTQENHEFRCLVDEYEVGLNCSNNDPIDLAKAIEYLSTNEALRNKMSLNTRKLVEEKFNRENTYKKIIDTIRQV